MKIWKRVGWNGNEDIGSCPNLFLIHCLLRKTKAEQKASKKPIGGNYRRKQGGLELSAANLLETRSVSVPKSRSQTDSGTTRPLGQKNRELLGVWTAALWMRAIWKEHASGRTMGHLSKGPQRMGGRGRKRERPTEALLLTTEKGGGYPKAHMPALTQRTA